MNKFTKEDKDKMVALLNLISMKAEFTMKTADVISFFKLLQHMQTVILPKIDDNILEVIAVHEAE